MRPARLALIALSALLLAPAAAPAQSGAAARFTRVYPYYMPYTPAYQADYPYTPFPRPAYRRPLPARYALPRYAVPLGCAGGNCPR